MPTAKAPPGAPLDDAERDRRNWAALVKTQMELHHVPSGAELARMIARPSVKRGDPNRWLRQETGPAPESAMRFAELFDLSVPETLRTAGYREIAEHLERLLGNTSPDVRAVLTAKARAIVDGAPEPEARAIIESVVTGTDDLLLAAEHKADKARAAEEGRTRRSAS